MLTMATIYLVQGDTQPNLRATLTDQTTGSPIDLTDSNIVVTGTLRKNGSWTLLATLTCTKVPGAEAQGQVDLDWDTTFASRYGTFKLSFVLTTSGTEVQTTFDEVPVKVRKKATA